MKNLISERIELIIKELGYNNNSFSKAIGLSNNVTIGRIINENREPSYAILERIIQTFGNINANWLLTGNGNAFLLKNDANNSNNSNKNGNKSGNITAKKDKELPQNEVKDCQSLEIENAYLRGKVDILKEMVESLQQKLNTKEKANKTA